MQCNEYVQLMIHVSLSMFTFPTSGGGLMANHLCSTVTICLWSNGVHIWSWGYFYYISNHLRLTRRPYLSAYTCV
jgi:hypothetical protein